MSFLYNLWQSFKRNAPLHLLTLCMLVLLFYISTNVVGHKASTDNFFKHCGYNDGSAENMVVEFKTEMNKQQKWDNFAISNKLNEDGCSASMSLDNLGIGEMITPLLASSLKADTTGGYFNLNYLGDGNEKPYEALVNHKYSEQYKIGQEYKLSSFSYEQGIETTEQINIKVVGYYPGKYTISMSFCEFRGLFDSNENDFMLCGVPNKKISYTIMMTPQRYAQCVNDLKAEIVNEDTLKNLYDKEKQCEISLVASDIIRIVLICLVMISTILSFTLFKFDYTKKYNYIKKVFGENKLINISTQVVLNLFIFLLAIAIVGVVGVIDPEILGGVFPNIGFGISVLSVAVIYFGMLAVTLYKENNFVKK